MLHNCFMKGVVLKKEKIKKQKNEITINKNDKKIHERFMWLAIKQAQKALNSDEVPVGCVIVKDGKIFSAGFNKKEKNCSRIYFFNTIYISF